MKVAIVAESVHTLETPGSKDSVRPSRHAACGPGARKKSETASAKAMLKSTSFGSTRRTMVPLH